MIDDILNKYINNENRSSGFTRYTTDGIRKILQLSGNPHEKIRSVHVAGTNGKGTTASLIAAILTANGCRTGLYTSPHLTRLNERIAVDGIDIPDDEFERIVAGIDTLAGKHGVPLTYFDMLTAAAFIYFHIAKTDIMVIECGLGGRLDTTNIITPLLSVITDIAVDHEKVLGSTIEEISEEKAGIIKNSVPSATSNTDEKILRILKKNAHSRNSDLHLSFHKTGATSFTGDGFSFTHTGLNIGTGEYFLPMAPESRIKNAALALTAVDILAEKHVKIDKNTLVETVRNFTIPGRFETGSSEPRIIFDVAHNAHSVEELIKTLRLYFPGKKCRLYLTIMKDKHPDELIRMFESGLTGDIVYIRLDDERNHVPEETGSLKVIPAAEVNSLCENISTEKINIFTGSFRHYSIYRNIILKFRNHE